MFSSEGEAAQGAFHLKVTGESFAFGAKRE